MRIARVILWAMVVAGLGVGTALADPLPGEFLKFQQVPMIRTVINQTPYYGHDEPSTAWAGPGSELPIIYQGNFMADDFADAISKPVVHVRWWGSYFSDPEMINGRVKKFLISFETDVPAGTPVEPGQEPVPFSRPGKPILSQIVRLGKLEPHSGTFTEKWISPGGDPLKEALFEYNAELRCPFRQEADKVYWLKIVALADPVQDINWGWHNRDYTRPDIFASGVPVPGEKLVGRIPDPAGTQGTPIWHFQDDAVSGRVVIHEFPDRPCHVYVEQPASTFTPQNYLDGIDGPGPITGFPSPFPGIGQYSKDLAFELYAIPEPSTLVLVGIGLASLIVPAWRRRR